MNECWSKGPAVEIGPPLLNIPVLRVDEPMTLQAVQMRQGIGVAATLRSTLEPTRGHGTCGCRGLGPYPDAESAS